MNRAFKLGMQFGQANNGEKPSSPVAPSMTIKIAELELMVAKHERVLQLVVNASNSLALAIKEIDANIKKGN